ncbi:hypothetical protein PHYBOEH_006227 [Phytophthora boehmeriae]|uniref:Transmembrane protein n=1 Tax=Phytophthora boehmeriae TaxID=109152 RepID=A0A8T1WKA7_9STRA|nr:hypothetical protein PHYBOEH_006227 [Phytophthora boehmeriae]
MAHELVSPHCSSWSFSSNFSFNGAGAAAATANVGKVDAASTASSADDDCETNSNYYEVPFSPTASATDGSEDDDRSRQSKALLVNYFAAGVFHGVVPALVYPLFKVHLGLQGYQANATQTLLGCAWHGKIFLCLLTDCVPIRGRKRTPYVCMGWAVVILVFSVMLIFHPTEPEFETSGAPGLILPIATASVGYLMVDAACDGLMVETVHRDSQIEEHSTFRITSISQSAVYTARFVAELVGTLLVGVGMNSEAYGGSFSFVLPLRTIVVILVVFALFALGATIWGFCETRHSDAARGATQLETIDALSIAVLAPSPIPSMRSKIADFWRILQQRATWQIASFGFLQKACLSFGMDSAPHSQAIHEFWLKTDPLTKSIFLAFSNGGVCVAASLFVHHRLLSASWHSTVLAAQLAGLVIGFPVALAVVFDTCRSKFLFLGAAAIVGFTDCVAMVVRMLVVVEIAEPGFESSTYGLVTSLYNLADPVTTAVGNAFGARFRVYDMDIEQDAEDRRDARELKTRGGSSKGTALVLFSVIGCAFIIGIAANFFAIFKNLQNVAEFAANQYLYHQISCLLELTSN